MVTKPTDHETKQAESKPTDVGFSRSKSSTELIEALANITIVESLERELQKYISAPYDRKTPKEKVNKRPDGYDYVASSWMDHESKENIPLYEFKLLNQSIELGWVICYVSLKNRITGNTELGAGAARIQVSRGVVEPGFRDVIDMSNNVKAALTNAIKNAQSRFGIAADVYQKRESLPNDDERKRYTSMLGEIRKESPTMAQKFTSQWEVLGTDWAEFLDKWQLYLDRDKSNDKNKVKL